MTILTEGDGAQSLQFEFSDDWTALKYDAPIKFKEDTRIQ